MKSLLFLLIALFLILQYKLWLQRDGFAESIHLKREIALQQKENEELSDRNQALIAEVQDLKSGHAAIEERARSELGMVKHGEIYYQVVK